MGAITIQCPDSVLRTLHEDEQQFAKEFSLIAAVKLYEMNRLSTGRAAELAGMSRLAFLNRLSEYGVSLYKVSEDELDRDVANA